MVKSAPAASLFALAFTFHYERELLLSNCKNDPEAEYKRFFEFGVGGVFSDFPDTAITARAG